MTFSTPAVARPRDDFGAIGVEVGLIQMRMRVEELHGTPGYRVARCYTTGFGGDERFERCQMPLGHVERVVHQRFAPAAARFGVAAAASSSATSCLP